MDTLGKTAPIAESATSEQFNTQMNEVIIELEDVIDQIKNTAMAELFDLIADNFDDILEKGKLVEISDSIQSIL